MFIKNKLISSKVTTVAIGFIVVNFDNEENVFILIRYKINFSNFLLFNDLEPIPKFDRNIANCYFNEIMPRYCNHHKNKNKTAITNILYELWDRKSTILPKEKPNNTIGRPAIPFRKVFNDILYVLRTGCQWKMLSSEFGSGSTCHRRFQEWVKLNIFKKMWTKLLEEYDGKRGIKLMC